MSIDYTEWVSMEDYNSWTTYKITDEDLFKILQSRSQDLINLKTFCRIDVKFGGFYNLPSRMKYLVQKSMIAQIEYFVMNGGLKVLSKGKMSSVTLNKFRYEYEGSGNNQTAASLDNARLCEQSVKYLSQTGLLYAGSRC